MNNRDVILKIIELLAIFRAHTELSTKALFNDINITNEGLSALLLNEAYSWKLEDLNTNPNSHPAIDLGDRINAIGVSVTASDTSTYIQDKINKNIEHKIYEIYPNHYFFITTKKKKYSTTFDTKGNYIFNKDEHILDTHDYASKAKKLNLEQQTKILKILQDHILPIREQFVEDLYPQDIAKVLHKLNESLGSNTEALSNEINSIIRTDIDTKNEINNLSQEYFKYIKQHSVAYFSQINEFLSKVENFEYKSTYLNIVSDLQNFLAINRDNFDKFDSIFSAIENFCVSKIPSLMDQRRVFRILLHFMYFQCDIGQNAN